MLRSHLRSVLEPWLGCTEKYRITPAICPNIKSGRSVLIPQGVFGILDSKALEICSVTEIMQILKAAAFAAFLEIAWAAVTCDGSFSAISASDYVAKLHPGWNLGNTLDAIPDEGSWNNAPVQFSTLDTVKAAGFKSVRLPGETPLLHKTFPSRY